MQLQLILLQVFVCLGQSFILDSKGYALIVDGEDATVGEFPFIVSLTKLRPDGSRLFFCGGSVLTQKIVITAGHCLVDEKKAPSKVVAYAGHHNRSDTWDAQKRTLGKIAVHPNYTESVRPFNIENDISLGFLTRPFALNDRVKVTRIPLNADNAFSGLDAIAAGWGMNREGKQPDILQKISLKVLTNQACQATFGSFPPIRANEICANRSTPGGICSGDSGGPLYIKSADANSLVLVGLTSWGRSCNEGEWPGVFVRVASHLDWINETMTMTFDAPFDEKQNIDYPKILFNFDDA